MNQTEAFIAYAGDEWYERNIRKLGLRDPVSDTLDRHPAIVPARVLEVGCANGWRLKKFRYEKYKCIVRGIDPSQRAVWAADMPEVLRGWADRLPFQDAEFDMVVYGFCLYVTDPGDWFRIAAEGDRVLGHGGHIVIHDFDDPEPPHARAYEHAVGVLAYHVRFVDFWLAHPWYRIVAWEHCSGNEQVVVLRKDTNAIPVRP